jgi:Winged helix-turn helix
MRQKLELPLAEIPKQSWNGFIAITTKALRQWSSNKREAIPLPLPKVVEAEIDQVIRKVLEVAATPPQDRIEAPILRWTLKRLVVWIREQFKMDCCRDTVRKVLKRLGFSWKKARKLLNKDNTQKRSEYLEILKGLMQDILDNDHLLIFIDEAHIHLDTDEGYGWSVKLDVQVFENCLGIQY